MIGELRATERGFGAVHLPVDEYMPGAEADPDAEVILGAALRATPDADLIPPPAVAGSTSEMTTGASCKTKFGPTLCKHHTNTFCAGSVFITMSKPQHGTSLCIPQYAATRKYRYRSACIFSNLGLLSSTERRRRNLQRLIGRTVTGQHAQPSFP